MQAPFYGNAEDISSKKYRNPSLCPKNRLHLLPEHMAQISTAFVQQLSFASLTSRELRILSAIYYQTIGHGKREDDMNGKCLELLTGIRDDHANEAVRRMAALDIVITRLGSYGKWMSINFDFKNWGKAVAETKTNNPNVLLSARYQLPLANEEAGKAFSLHDPQFVKKEPVEVQVKVKTKAKVNAKPQEEVSSTDNCLADKKQIHPPAKPFTIHYPDSLSKQLCQRIAGYLKEIGVEKQAQRLVDYFADRLQNGSIRKPIAYFINLKNRLLAGQLDLSETSCEIDKGGETNVTKQKKADQKLPTLRAEYQIAFADYQQLKNRVECIVSNNKCSFDEALASIHYTNIWQKAAKRVDDAIKALKTHQKTNPSASQNEVRQQKEEEVKRVTHEMPQHIGDILQGVALLPS
ncbi:MAG: replication protein [Cocleimonas sp.]|nr:replication protein [Cocleimonas sp.]